MEMKPKVAKLCKVWYNKDVCIIMNKVFGGL